MLNKFILIERTKQNEKQTAGNLSIYKNQADWIDPDTKPVFECFTLELAWKNNIRNESRIHPGVFPAKKHNSPKFGKSIHIQKVPGRTEILIHRGNFHMDTKGCILVGDDYADINGDGFYDVINSTSTMKKLLSLINDKLIVVIHNNF